MNGKKAPTLVFIDPQPNFVPGLPLGVILTPPSIVATLLDLKAAGITSLKIEKDYTAPSEWGPHCLNGE
jgi:hypothetical protein